jgi:DNA repair protein RecN (Recombination protein N)
MLLELRAENYAVIDRAVATFGLGLNLVTGKRRRLSVASSS